MMPIGSMEGMQRTSLTVAASNPVLENFLLVSPASITPNTVTPGPINLGPGVPISPFSAGDIYAYITMNPGDGYVEISIFMDASGVSAFAATASGGRITVTANGHGDVIFDTNPATRWTVGTDVPLTAYNPTIVTGAPGIATITFPGVPTPVLPSLPNRPAFSGYVGTVRFLVPDTVDNDVTFTLDVEFYYGFPIPPPIPPIQFPVPHTFIPDPAGEHILSVSPPSITSGPAGITLEAGYTSGESAPFVLSYAPTPNPNVQVTVTGVTAADDPLGLITWNALTNRLDIAPGLLANTTHTVVIEVDTQLGEPYTRTFTVTVSPEIPVTGITLTPNPLNMVLNTTVPTPLTINVLPMNATNPTVTATTWTSNNLAVATVDAAGVVTAVGEGTATISVAATTGDGVFNATATVNVSLTPVSPVITPQPTNQTVTAGQAATFTSGATGVPTPSFQWQISTNNGASWTNMVGETSATLQVPNTTVAMSGNQFQLVATSSAGSITSNAVTLIVNPAPQQPPTTPQPPQQPTPPPSTPAPSPSPPPPTPIPYIIPQNETTVIINNAVTRLAAGQELVVVFVLEDRPAEAPYIGAEISGEDWALILEHEGTIIMQGRIFSAHVTYDQLTEWDIEGAGIITLLLHHATAETDDEEADAYDLTLATQLLGQETVTNILVHGSINETLLGLLHKYSVQADGAEIETATPTTITVDLTTLGLTPEQLIRLTGFVIDEETGSYVLLPGVFTEDGRTFTFDFDGSGIIGIMVYTMPNIFMRLTIGSLEYYLNGEILLSDVAPHIAQNRTLVPIRIVTEALGGTPRWDGSNRVAYLYFDDVTLRLPMGTALPDGLGMPVMLNNRVFVPLRYVSQFIGARVFWDAANRAVYVWQR